jgi:hypothetical protein
MTRTVKVANDFPKLNLSVIETIFSSAGEVIETSHSRPIEESFHIKSFMFKGGRKIEFPNTDQEPIIGFAPGTIVPGPLMIGKKHLKITILEDDTRDYCIRNLTMDCPINASITDVDAGNYLDITKGCLIYVHGTSYTLNDIICTESELFALENNDAKITATDSCEVYIFRAILKDY